MAKTITSAALTQTQTTLAPVVVATVTMPASEFEAFRVLAGLTDAVPSAVTAFIAARLAAGDGAGQ